MIIDNGTDEQAEAEAEARFAIVKGDASLDTVRAYLPSNYSARLSQWQDKGTVVLIEGVDSAGWTLDGYVIPRLGSGLIFAEEVTFDEAEAEAEAEASAPTLTPEQSDVVDMLRGRINSGLVGFDADGQLTILETVRAMLTDMIDKVISELVDDDDETDDETDDEYEPVSLCPACGSPIDYCQGHGEIGDPSGWAILQAHDVGDHSECAIEADCLGLAD